MKMGMEARCNSQATFWLCSLSLLMQSDHDARHALAGYRTHDCSPAKECTPLRLCAIALSSALSFALSEPSPAADSA